nr:serine/threonine-protein phosphatase [Actinomycetota bacterium]
MSRPEIARAVDRSVTRGAGDEDFVTALFAEFDPHGWLELVTCGHPPPPLRLRLTADGGLQALNPAAYATPLGLHPDLRAATFSIGAGDRLVFCTDGLLEARSLPRARPPGPPGRQPAGTPGRQPAFPVGPAGLAGHARVPAQRPRPPA